METPMEFGTKCKIKLNILTANVAPNSYIK